MGKKVEKESKSVASVKSGVKAVKGMDLDKVKSAMTPDKVKVATPGLKKKEKLVGTPVTVKENKIQATPKSTKKEKKKSTDTPAAKTPKGKENVEVAKSASKKKKKEGPIEVKHLELSTIESGVKSFLKMLDADAKTKKVEVKEDSKSDLLAEDPKQLFEEAKNKVFLQVAGIKMPRLDDTTVINCTLPHGWVEPDANILLIVKDLKKDNKHDHEETLLHYQDMVRKANIPANIEVMPHRQLRMEYREWEVKADLVKRIDRVLVDKKIMNMVPRQLGKPFYSKKKIPIAVDVRKEDLKEEIMRGIKSTLLPINNHGTCTSVAVGRTNQTEEMLIQNIESVIKRIRGKYPGGWKNIRSVALMSNNRSIFLYMSERNSEEVPEVFTEEYIKNKREPVEDELSTIPGATVIVHQSGAVTVKRVADPEWDEIVEGMVDEKHPDLDDDDVEVRDPNYKKKNKVEEKPAKKQKVDEKSSKKKNDDSDDDDDDMDKMEMEYMQRVAKEEEMMEKKEKENMKKLMEEGNEKPAAKDAEEDSDAEKEDSDAEEEDSDAEKEESDAEDDSDAEEEDSDADDDIEAENLVSDGEEDSDADLDESALFMKRKVAEVELEEDTLKKKKKPSKKQKRQEIKNIKAKKPGGSLSAKTTPKKKATPKKNLSKGPASGKAKLGGVKDGKIKKSKK